jgi:phosphatidylglycerol---prolipoprotein diacylglyceryl transferase
MYPNLYYVFKDFFGVRIGFLRFVNSFGFFVAIAFLVGAALLAKELKRKSQQGLLKPTENKVTVGKPATTSELVINFLLGFVLGFKILALFIMGSEVTQDPQAYIFSKHGSLTLGLLTGAVFAWMKWRERHKQQLKHPEQRVVRIWPHDRVGEITIIALVVGLLGAKLFDIFENWSDFLKAPADFIFSGGGLTFYGGLICSTIALVIYCRKNQIGVRHMADAIAPTMMIAYAIGRIGCHVAGDGDWGVYNSAFKVDSTQHIAKAAPNEFTDTVAVHADYFVRHYPSLDSIPHRSFPKPGILGFLPNSFFAYNYPHNVNKIGIPIAGCDDIYCTQLPIPVIPTSPYETFFCTLLFLVLWFFRTRLQIAGMLFAFYLVLNGIERFFIEQIRVNNRMDLFGLHPSQAEVIALGLIIVGIGLGAFLWQKDRAKVETV